MKSFSGKYKIKISLTVLLILLDLITIAQQDIFYQSHATYWYYRTRLRNDFMLVGSGPGMSIPMQERGLEYYPYYNTPKYYQFNSTSGSGDGQTAAWGDAMSDLGYYLGVLATEYALLSKNGQSTDSTLKEIYYALWALNRLDMNADPLYNSFAASPSTPLPSNFDPNPSTINGYLNGFSMRDDVQSDFVSNNYLHFNYYGDRGFCSNIKIDNSFHENEYKCGWGSLYPGHNLSPTQDWSGTFISQDNWYDALLGLMLVRKLVPSGTTYLGKSFQDGRSDINAETWEIAWRTYNYFNYRTTLGHIVYPDGNAIPSANGGGVATMGFAHSEAIGRMGAHPAGWNYDNPTEGTYAFHDLCDKHSYLNTGHYWQDLWNNSFGIAGRWVGYLFANHSNYHLPFTNTVDELNFKLWYSANHNSNVDPMYVNLLTLCNCYYDFNSNITGGKLTVDEFDHTNASGSDHSPYNFYHTQMIRTILDSYEACGYGESNPFPDWRQNGEQANVWNNLLSSAPCEIDLTTGSNNYHTSGPYSFPGSTWGPMNPYFEWSTTSRMDHPQRRGAGDNPFPGEYNGLDYMLYHNLYLLLRMQTNWDNSNLVVDFSNRILTLPYPLSSPNTNSSNPWGSATNPATVSAYEVIHARCAVNSNAVVDMKAGKEIAMLPGFSAATGSTLSATIQHLNCSDIFNQNNSYDNINGRETTHNANEPTKTFAYYQSLPTHFDVPKKSNSTPETKTDNIVATKSSVHSFLKPSASSLNPDLMPQMSSSIYPNPNAGEFTLLLNDPNKIVSFELQTFLGQIIYSYSGIIIKENKIDISAFPSGIYMLKITDINKGVCYKKVVKN